MELETLSSPLEIHSLQIEELESLAFEIRNQIISVSLKNGGHLGASLGTVELAIALHRVFHSPRDKIIWDVGHQAYAHKLLTGRSKNFSTLRKTGGVSGFLSRDESEHDIFGAGHSSTSLSAALGVSYENPNWTVAVIGDGALTAGIALEALNQISSLPKRGPLLVVLNDNQMSISKNVGSIPEILRGRDCGEFFEHFGFDYVGPIDGHQLGLLLSVINGIHSNTTNPRPVLLHVLTQKGRGYSPAEDRPETYHGVSPQGPKVVPSVATDKTEPLGESKSSPKEKGWSQLFGETLIDVATKDESIVAITAAMSDGTGLSEFFNRFPERSFDVGIAEPHAVTFSAGLAVGGKKPIVAIYSTFLQRAIDSMIHDVALQKLDVLFAVDRAGLVGADGPTHHGVFDLVYASMIPGFQLFIPQAEEDFSPLFHGALSLPGPKLIRYPRGTAKRRGSSLTEAELQSGFRKTGSTLESARLIVFSIGPIGERISKIREQTENIKILEDVCHIQLFQPKTPDNHLQKEILQKIQVNSTIIFYEEGVQRGSLSEGIASTLSNPKVFRCLPAEFVPHGAPADLDRLVKWDEVSILQDLSPRIKQ
jgi:1-deoxy-D-xylulose-5-phosphate synthase